MQRITHLILLAIISLLTAGQSLAQHSWCGTVTHDEFLTVTDADYRESRAEAERKISQWKNFQKSSGDIIIPVVVHVVYRLSEQNISESQIQSQITALNKDFNKQNWDTSKVPGIWKNLIADCGIRFELANRDMQGNRTNGITRTQTTVQDIASPSGNLYYQSSKGGKDAWDRDTYLNIWVCEITGSLYGFGSYPGAPKASDGIVIQSSSFGTMGTVTQPTDKGRTLTHELGHWFGLRHIWGDAVCGDDLISDTPEQETSNYECPSFPHVSCSNGPAGDMFMNYMDYTDDPCMNMFTEEQKDHMLSTLNSVRASLLTSPGYNGINRRQQEQRITIFPNPVRDLVMITPVKDEESLLLTVYTSDGRLMLESVARPFNGRIEADFGHLPEGLYILRLEGTNQRSVEKFQVVRH